MKIPQLSAAASISDSPVNRGQGGLMTRDLKQTVVPAQETTNVKTCPPGHFCPKCEKLPCVMCTESYWTGFCHDFEYCPDGTKSPVGADYWCGWWSGGPHHSRCP